MQIDGLACIKNSYREWLEYHHGMTITGQGQAEMFVPDFLMGGFRNVKRKNIHQ